jgi:hypothetical protein
MSEDRNLGVAALAPVMHGIHLVDGYEQFIPSAYSSLTGINPDSSFRDSPEALLEQKGILDMLNTGTLIYCSERASEPDPAAAYEEIARIRNCRVLRNPGALPRAYAVLEARKVDDIESAAELLLEGEVDPSTTALIHGAGFPANTTFSPGEVKVAHYGFNRVLIEAQMPEGPGLVVLADQSYPGWKAYVNSKEKEIFTANAVLRAVEVPGGKSTIEFIYRPGYIYPAFGASVAALCLIGLVVFLGQRRQKAPEADEGRS